jgi:hypothetical protein
MAAISTYTVLTMQGAVTPATGERLEEITRPGVDGVAFRRIGKKGAAFKLQTTVDTESAAGARTLYDNYKALQGQLVTITDTSGRIYTDIMVLNVQASAPQRILGASSGVTANPNYLLNANWQLQATI